MLKTHQNYGTKYQIAINIIWSAIAGFIGYGINLFIIPIVSEQIGIEAYGFIGLADTFISYIGLITVALNAFAARYIALYYHKGDYEQANIFYNSVILSNILLSFMIFIPCSYGISKIETLVLISPEIVNDVRTLFMLVLINYLLNILGTAFCAAVFIKNKTNITYQNKAIQSLVYIAALYLLAFFFGIKVYIIAEGQIIASGIALLLNYYYSRKIVPELIINVTNFSWSSVKKLISSGIWTSFNNIGNILNSGLDLLICNRFLSPVIMGQLSVVNQISTLMTGVTMLFINAFQPKQLEAYAKENISELQRLLHISMRLVSIMGSTFFITFFILGKEFFKLWLPSQDTAHIFSICSIVLIGDMVVVVIRPLYYVYTLTDRLRKIFWITIVSGICNVISMLILVPNTTLGIYAVVGSTMVLNIIVNISTVFRAARYLEIKRFAFAPIVCRHILGCIAGVALFSLFTKNINCDTWKEFISVCGLVGSCAAVFSIIVQFIFTDDVKYFLKIRINRK